MLNEKKTYKLLIADDEALARYAFRTMISKNFTNIEVIGEAENGREAIDLNRTLNPDIVVMDIRMPGINGIDASRQILEEFPNQKILILTAYDNFGYVQQAIDIGVKGYLLKPIKKEEVIEKFNKILEEVSSKSDNIILKEEVENKIKVVKPFIEKELISAFISTNSDLNEVKSYINFLQEKIVGGCFMLISTGFEGARHINDSVRNSIVKEKVFTIIEKHLPSMIKCILGHSIGNVMTIFIPLDLSKETNDACANKIKTLALELKSRIKIMANVDVSIGIGGFYNNIEDFRLSYEEANKALRKAVTNNSIEFFTKDSQNNTSYKYSYPYSLEEELVVYLRIGKHTEAMNTLNDILDKIFVLNYDIENVKEQVVLLITMLKRTLSQLGIEISQSVMINLVELLSLKRLDELRIWTTNSVTSMLYEFEKSKALNTSPNLKLLRDCVNNPYSRECTLENAAEKVGVTPQYLSKIFKEEFKTNFIDYIIEKRMSYARELLNMGNKSIKDISNLVGYDDPNYFCRIFKKSTGLTPKEYQKNRQD